VKNCLGGRQRSLRCSILIGVEGFDVAPNEETKDDSSSSNDDDDESSARKSSGYRGARRLALAKDYFTGPQPNIMVVKRKINIGYAEGLFIRDHIDEDKMNLLLRANGLLTNGGSSPLEPDWTCPGIKAEECKTITKSW
jgi:hypothetical protein